MRPMQRLQPSPREPRVEPPRPRAPSLRGVAGLAALALAPSIAAQGSAPGAAGDPLRLRLDAGEQALARGERSEAYGHFLRALLLDEEAALVHAGLLAAAEEDADAQRLWALDLAGTADLGRAGAGLPAGERGRIERLAQLRVAAVEELAAFARAREKKAGRAPDERLVALWARRLALELADPVPALRRAWRVELAPEPALTEDVHGPVVAALQRLLPASLGRGDAVTAFRAARILQGLVAQTGFHGLQGPAPRDLEKLRRPAAEGLAQARRMLRERDPRASRQWTVAELEALGPAEADAFTRAHASPATPGVALSPSGLYRIETECGHATLLGAASTVEDHHRRLALWLGSDPFADDPGPGGDRPGIVRIVPGFDGLEGEGITTWWAQGQQEGDVSTVRFACGSVEDLGRVVTHELTHRFDGALHPGLPRWLSEGRAVWAAGAYAHSSDEETVEAFGDFARMEAAFRGGFGRPDLLQALIEGTLGDGRHDYVAGFALYLYLETWEDEEGRAPYRERLAELMRTAGGTGARRGEPLARFVELFADGEDGRPRGFAAFAEAFGAFLRGFHWREREPWTRRYVPSVVVPGREPWIYDGPTWVFSRRRAEPSFGQDQARLAAALLAEAGKTGEALRAHVWARAADGRDPRAERGLLELLLRERREDAAWVVRAELARGAAPAAAAELGAAPFAGALPRTHALLDAWDEAARAWREEGLLLAAAALGAQAEHLAARLGSAAARDAARAAGPGNGAGEDPGGEAGARELLHPFDPPPRHLGADGWVEDGLTGFEERRVEGLWHETPERHLVVGRERPASFTGRTDRAAHERDAYARTAGWILSGSYRIRGRVRFTTAYVRGAIVLGSTRRDRNVRLAFEAGNFEYAIGDSDVEPAFDALLWRLDCLRERDPALPGSLGDGSFAFGRAVPSFAFELVVDGPVLRVSIDGEHVATYHTVDGAPIEGHVGFAAGYGAFEVQEPTLERLERSRRAGGAGRSGEPLALDLAASSAPPFEDLTNLPALGLDPPPQGALLLWVPRPTLDEALDAARTLGEHLARAEAPQPLLVAVPDGLTEPERARLGELLSALSPPGRLLQHALPAGAGGGAAARPDRNERWVLFVDPAGAIRWTGTYAVQRGALDGRLSHWLGAFRGLAPGG